MRREVRDTAEATKEQAEQAVTDADNALKETVQQADLAGKEQALTDAQAKKEAAGQALVSAQAAVSGCPDRG